MPGVPQPTAAAMRAGSSTPPQRDDRQDRLPAVGEFADDQFALEFEAGDEEEDREQSVLRPRPERQVQVEELRSDLEVAQRGVGVAEGGVDPDQRDRGGDEQQ